MIQATFYFYFEYTHKKFVSFVVQYVHKVRVKYRV